MTKKIYLWLFVLLLCSVNAFGYGLNQSAITYSDPPTCQERADAPMTRLFNETGAPGGALQYFGGSDNCANNSVINITLNDTYTITSVRIINASQRAGVNAPHTGTIVINGTTVGQWDYDGTPDSYQDFDIDIPDTNGSFIQITMHNFSAAGTYFYASEWKFEGSSVTIDSGPIITLMYPTNDTIWENNPLYINVTTNELTENCSINSSDWSYYWNDSTNWSWTNSTSLVDGNYSYEVSCWDPGGLNESITVFFIVDSTLPLITWNTPADANTTVVSYNLTADIDLYDPNLYSYYYNITYWRNGTLFNNYTNLSLTGFTNVTINNTDDMSGYSGEFLATVRSCDGHTKDYVKFKSVKRVDNELRFDAVNIYIEDKQNTEKYDYTKLYDRYNMNFTTTTSKTKESFIVESDQYIDILHGQTKYEGHLISGNKWIDFESSDIKKIDIDRITGSKVRVTVTKHNPTKKWFFNSVGELNCNEESRRFYVTNYTTYYDPLALSGDIINFTFNMTHNGTYITSSSLRVYVNNTQYTMTADNNATLRQYNRNVSIVTGADVNLSVIYEYAINGVYYNTTSTDIQMFAPAIDNCTTYSQQWINFTLLDELNLSPQIGDVDYRFDFSNGAYSSYYNGSRDSVNNLSFCLYPAWANFTTDIFLQYDVTGFDKRDYVQDDFIVDNITNEENLYVLLAGLSTEVTLHVIDSGDNDLPNVFIQAYKWDIATDTYQLVETEYTDSEGNAIFDLRIGSEYYRFQFYRDGELELETTRYKIFSTTQEFVLDSVEESVLNKWLTINTVDTTLTYDNATSIITFTWDDSGSLATQYCLHVSDYNYTFYDTCNTSSTGTLSYTITTTNITYIAQGIAAYDGNDYVLESLGIDTRGDWRRFGKNLSLFVSMIIFMFVSLLLINSAKTHIVGSMAAMFFIALFGFTYLPMEAVVGIICVGIIELWIMGRRR